MSRPGSQRSAAMIAAGQSAVKATQLVLAVVLVRLLTPDDWNRIAYLLSIHLAVVTFGGIGLQQTLLFFVARNSDPPRRLVVRTASMVAVLGAMIAVVLWRLAPLLGSTLGVVGLVSWVGLAALLELPTTCAQPALIALQRFRAASSWDIACSVLLLGTVLAGAALDGANGVVTALVLAGVIRLIGFLCLLTTLPSGPRLDTVGGLARQLAYAVPLGLTLATGVLTRSLDKWYISAFHPSMVGGYAIAAQEIPLLAVVPYAGTAAVAATLTESFRANDLAGALGIWRAQTESMIRLLVPLSVGLMMLAPFIVPLATDVNDTTLVITFALFTAITLHRVAEYGVVLRAAGRPRDVLGSALVLLTANAVLAGFGAWRWGVIGSAAGTLAANGLAWVWVLRRIAVALGTDLRHVFPWRSWFMALLSAALAFAVAFGSGTVIDAPLASAAAQAVVFGAVAVIVDRQRPRTSPVRLGAVGAG